MKAKDLIEKLAAVHRSELDQSGCADLSVWNTVCETVVVGLIFGRVTRSFVVHYRLGLIQLLMSSVSVILLIGHYVSMLLRYEEYLK